MGEHLLKQGLWQWYVIPEWLPKVRVRKPSDSFCCVSRLESVSASSRWTGNIHSQKFFYLKVSILIRVPLGRGRRVSFEKPKFKWTKGKEGATTVLLISPFIPPNSWRYLMSSETSLSHVFWIAWVIFAIVVKMNTLWKNNWIITQLYSLLPSVLAAFPIGQPPFHYSFSLLTSLPNSREEFIFPGRKTRNHRKGGKILIWGRTLKDFASVNHTYSC